MWRVASIGLLLLGAIAGCRGAEHQAPPEHQVPPEDLGAIGLTDAATAWHIESEPRLSLDGVTTDVPVQWYRVRGVGRLGDGRLVVADGSLRVFILGPDGRLITAFGGEGDGPGEFRNIGWLQILDSDSLLLSDPRRRRVSFFSSEGEYGRSVSIPPTDLRGMFEDGTFASSWNVRVSPPAVGVYEERVEIRRHSANGDIIEVMDTVRGSDAAIVDGPRGRMNLISLGALSPTAFRRSPVRQLWIAVGRRRMYVGAGDSTVAAYPIDGGPPTAIGRPYPPVPFTEEALRLSGLEGVGSMYLELPERARPASMPFTTMFLVDDSDHLWVEAFSYDTASEASWSVFDGQGVFLAELSMPRGFQPFQIGQDFILGVWRDSLDVEYVRLYRLSR